MQTKQFAIALSTFGRIRAVFPALEWDPDKDGQNRRKHRVPSQEAVTVFGDSLALTYPDPDHSTSEQRFITIGVSSAGRVLIVAHTDRGRNIRIISARKTTQRERKNYEETN